MAQVVPDSQQARIEHFLTYALREWAAVPDYVAEFNAWDQTDQLVFVHEWAIRESALEVLSDYADQALLTSDQCARYDELLKLIAKHRSTLEKLLRD